MEHLTLRVGEGSGAADLRLRISQLREALSETTVAYRKAAAQHNSGQSIGLLRSRSQLMRELLETQCKLLLSFRTIPLSDEREGPPR